MVSVLGAPSSSLGNLHGDARAIVDSMRQVLRDELIRLATDQRAFLESTVETIVDEVRVCVREEFLWQHGPVPFEEVVVMPGDGDQHGGADASGDARANKGSSRITSVEDGMEVTRVATMETSSATSSEELPKVD